MLTLDPNSVCDVCAEEYGPLSLPRCIPCGHVLCENCSTTICSKTSPRLSPACPFCREPFAIDDIRVIRVDCSSAANTPRKPILCLEAPEETILWTRRDDDRPMLSDTDGSKSHAEARRLEDKVAKVAAKKCSVEEVHMLHKELQEWLTSDSHLKSDQYSASLQLSAALIRAILMNHLAHSEAMKVAKGVEANLRERLEDGELIRQKLEGENRKFKSQLSQKTSDYQHVKSELGRFKVSSTTTSLGLATTPTHLTSPATPSRSRRQSVSTVQITPDNVSTISIPSTPTPHLHNHARTTSLQVPSLRSGAMSTRSMTPGPGHSRSMTPAPPPLPRAMTPAVPIHRPPVPPKPRTLTGNSPPHHRGIVDDREHEKKDRPKRHERWIPSPEPPSSGGGRINGFAALFGSARSKSS